jgi:ribosomal protein L24E
MTSHFVLEGDWGGQVYLTIPITLTTERKVRAALPIIDALEWETNEGEGAACYTQDSDSEEGVWGGMGGGLMTDGLWLHDSLLPCLKIWVREFLLGSAVLPSSETMIEWYIRQDGMLVRYYSRKQKKFLRMMRRAYRRASWNLEHDVTALGSDAIGPIIAGMMSEMMAGSDIDSQASESD